MWPSAFLRVERNVPLTVDIGRIARARPTVSELVADPALPRCIQSPRRKNLLEPANHGRFVIGEPEGLPGPDPVPPTFHRI
jgi:hypothetical protein